MRSLLLHVELFAFLAERLPAGPATQMFLRNGDPRSALCVVVMDLLFDLRDRHGSTLVLVTHSQALAERCDRVIALRDGHLA